jgi:hypothetical protein
VSRVDPPSPRLSSRQDAAAGPSNDSPARRASRFERHPRLTLFVLALVAVTLADFGFTFVYSLLRPGFYRDHSAFRVRSPIYHHGFQPGVSVDDERWGPLVASYRIDSLGFRDRAVRQVPLRSAEWRAVLIGDSFTEGIGVPYEDTFAGIAAASLLPSGVEVLNAGAASFSPIIYLRRVRNLLEDIGLRFDHLVVFIDVGDIQDEVTYAFDERGNVVSREARRLREERANRVHGRPFFLRSLAVRRFLDRHTLLLARLYEAADLWFTRGPRRAAQWTVDPQAFEEYGREGLESARAHMDELAELVARHGIGLTVAVYPWPDHVMLGDRDSKQVSFWRAWAAGKHAGFLDYFPLFVGVGEAKETVRREFIPGDIHWNAAGHRVIAGPLVEHLRSLAARRAKPPAPP